MDNAGGRARGAITELDPDAIADSHFHLHWQQRSAWVCEIELRPWVGRSEAKPPRGRLVPAIDVLKRRMAVEEWVPGPTAGRGIYRSGLQ